MNNFEEWALRKIVQQEDIKGKKMKTYQEMRGQKLKFRDKKYLC